MRLLSLVLFLTVFSLHSMQESVSVKGRVPSLQVLIASQLGAQIAASLTSSSTALEARLKAASLIGESLKAQPLIGRHICPALQYKAWSYKTWPIDSVHCARFSPDGKIVVVGCFDGSVKIIDVETTTVLDEIAPTSSKAVFSVNFSPDGSQIVTASWDRFARVYDVDNGDLSYELEHYGDLSFAEFSPDGKHIVTLDNESRASLWDAATREIIYIFASPVVFSVSSMKFSTKGDTLFLGSQQGNIIIFTLATRRYRRYIIGKYSINYLDVSPDGKYFCFCDEKVRIFDLSTKLLSEIKTHGVPQFTADGRYYFTINTLGKTIRLWDIKTNNLVHTFAHNNANDAKIDNFWVEQKKIWQSFPYGDRAIRRIRSARFDTNAKRLLVVFSDGTIKLWSGDQNLEQKLLMHEIQNTMNNGTQLDISMTDDIKAREVFNSLPNQVKNYCNNYVLIENKPLDTLMKKIRIKSYGFLSNHYKKLVLGSLGLAAACLLYKKLST